MSTEQPSAEATVLAARRHSTPDLGQGRRRRFSLPADLLGQSCKRVGVASLVFAALWTIPLLVHYVVGALVPGMDMRIAAGLWPMPGTAIAGAGAVLSVGMGFIARRLSPRPELLLDVGLGYEVVMAFLVGLMGQWVPAPNHFSVSWIVLVILVYPAIVHNTPKKTLIAALAAASMDPLTLGITALRGAPVPLTPFEYVGEFLPTYIAAFLAVLPAHIIRGLGRQVHRARELGSYRLNERLGSGGMGEVYRATHRMLARPAAIKLIRPEVLEDATADSGRVLIERFRREAEAAATLRSPHTIELYDFGVSDNGTFYYVMELLDGIDLDTLVERYGPVPPERAVDLLKQLCLSLAEAHQRGLIHRDIKPSNVHTCRMGLTVDFVKVLDFGLVKADRPQRRETMLTAPDMTTGTPAFMAPEIALGEERIDRRADIYAMGCLAYWLITGKLVFEAENAVKMMFQHIQAKPEPPSTRTELPVPPELDDVILACLAKSPADRPRDALELSRLLAAVPLAEPWSEERAQRWWQRHLPAPAPARELELETERAVLVTAH